MSFAIVNEKYHSLGNSIQELEAAQTRAAAAADAREQAEQAKQAADADLVQADSAAEAALREFVDSLEHVGVALPAGDPPSTE